MVLGISVDSQPNEPVFTCTTSGGPATTLTWERPTEIEYGDVVDTATTLVDATTATYNHTLTLNETVEGDYACFVSNNKPSSAKAIATFNGT